MSKLVVTLLANENGVIRVMTKLNYVNVTQNFY